MFNYLPLSHEKCGVFHFRLSVFCQPSVVAIIDESTVARCRASQVSHYSIVSIAGFLCVGFTKITGRYLKKTVGCGSEC